MNERTAIELIKNCLALLALLIAWRAWKGYVLDNLRQDLFKMRDDLFDLAARQDLGLKFNHKVYCQLRKLINGLIRFGHSLTVGKVLYLALFGQRQFQGEDETQRLISNVLDEELRKKLSWIRFKVFFAVLKYMALSSPPIFLLCLPFLVIQPLYQMTDTLKTKIGERLSGAVKVISVEAQYFSEESECVQQSASAYA